MRGSLLPVPRFPHWEQLYGWFKSEREVLYKLFQLNNVDIGEYSYIQNDCDILYTKIGKFVSIASNVRINSANHPWWRPALHHFT